MGNREVGEIEVEGRFEEDCLPNDRVEEVDFLALARAART
jgi:hypothetical protein